MDYFNILEELTKQEIIYNFEEVVYPQGTVIFGKEKPADRMMIVRNGVVNVQTMFDSRDANNIFIIEKLCPGSIINPHSFLVEETSDADFVSATIVKTFEISIAKMEAIAIKNKDLQKSL